MGDDHQLDQHRARSQRTDPHRSRSQHRNLVARALLVPGIGAVITGMVIEHGLLIVAGLVLTGIAGHLVTPRHTDSTGRSDGPAPPKPPHS